jgi:predicted transcriptional regulator
VLGGGCTLSRHNQCLLKEGMMSKSLVEMTVEIVAAQASMVPLSPDDIAHSMHKVYKTLQAVNQAGNSAGVGENISKDPESSIQQHQVICVECGKAFTLLSNRHLAQHGLTPRMYKQKHGIRLTQALSARTLSARRRRLAKELGMGKQLEVWRAERKQQVG